MSCKKCHSENNTKAGFARGHPRDQCKDGRYYFTNTPPRGKPPAMKAFAVLLYTMGNASQGMIARLLGVSPVAIYRWIGAASENVPTPVPTSTSGIVQIDEMWHFVNGKKTKFGSGERWTLWTGEPWPGSWVGVMMRRSNDSWTKWESKETSL